MLKSRWACLYLQNQADTGSQSQPVGLHLQFVKSLLPLQRESHNPAMLQYL